MSDVPAARKSTIKADSRVYFAALGRRITQLRKSRGYTQAEFARALGVSQQAVFAYELGDRRASVMIIERIATLYGIQDLTTFHCSTYRLPRDDSAREVMSFADNSAFPKEPSMTDALIVVRPNGRERAADDGGAP